MEYKQALDEETSPGYVAGEVETGTIHPLKDRGSVWFVEIETTTGDQHKRLVQVISRADNGRLLSRLQPDKPVDITDLPFKLRPGKLHLSEAK